MYAKTKNNPQEKFVVLYDTAKKCLLIIDHLYSDFENAIDQTHDIARVGKDPSIVIKIYISAFGLIDHFHRFHEIISAMTLIRKDQPELKKLNTALKPVTGCRNYLQHMRGDLMKNDPITYPILGAISWIYEGRNYTLFSSQPTKGISSPGIVYDTLLNTYICRYQLVAAIHEIHIDSVYDEIKTFWRWLEGSVTIQPGHVKDYTWGKPTIIHSEFKRK